MIYERHGHTPKGNRSDTYPVWQNMIQRCTNKKNDRYKFYGGRGITVCDRWKGSFANFLADMGPRPEGKQIDRIDNNKGYEPGNCRWATKHEQMQNTRTTKLIEFDGEVMGKAAWARKIGISTATLNGRLKRGWSMKDALTKPKMKRGR